MPSRDKLKAAFLAFDVDASGTLSRDEFAAVLKRTTSEGKEMSDEDVQDLLEMFDENEDGVLSISEFIDAMETMFDEEGDGGEGEGDHDDEEGDDEGAGDDDDAAGEAADADTAKAASSASASASSAFVKPDGWLEFELGIFNGREQLKAYAPIDSDLDEPMEGMITGKTDDGNTVVFVVTMAVADEDASGVDAAALDAAVQDFVETYDKVSHVTKELLADGYVFTAQNEPEIGGTNFWMMSRRFYPGKGKAWNVEATAATAEQQMNAVSFAKSIHE